ncbi:MAG: antitoxin VapB family protein [Haloarculaceae archaeon]
MPTRTISLDRAAYERLRAEKREGESFSDVIKRLAGDRSWSEVAGIWAGASDIRDAIDEGRARSRDRREGADESFPE